MGFEADQLRDKALMALEEALQDVRYPPARRPLSLRFALAYLWTISSADRSLFEEFWRALQSTSPWSLGSADMALRRIYTALGLERDEAPSWHFWKARQEEEREQREDVR
jgi:hypothetical protein